MMLTHSFSVLRLGIPGPTQKLTSSLVICIVADDVSLCPGSDVFKTFIGNVP